MGIFLVIISKFPRAAARRRRAVNVRLAEKSCRQRDCLTASERLGSGFLIR